MYAGSHPIKPAIAGMLACLMTMTAAAAATPVAGQQVRFPKGTWSALSQLGPDGKVRQCVLVAFRQRTGKEGPVETRFALNISRGVGLAVTIQDDGLATEDVLDDQAELVIDGRTFPAVGFPIGTVFVFHPGDAAGALAMLGSATQVRLRSDGAGIDSGSITIDLPREALNWLRECGRTFDIAIDKPTDPNAPELPTPRVRSPDITVLPATPAGPPGINNKQKIQGWDASELRNNEGRIIVCLIRRHYTMGSESGSRTLGTFLTVSRLKGLTMMLKDSKLHQVEGKPIDASFKIGDRPFADFSAQVLGHDEIGIFPEHGTALASALANGDRAIFTPANGDVFDFPVQSGVLAWLRACARRNGMGLDSAGQ
jgi:hypothetical protein